MNLGKRLHFSVPRFLLYNREHHVQITKQYSEGSAWCLAHSNCSLKAFASPSPSPYHPFLLPHLPWFPVQGLLPQLQAPAPRAWVSCHQAHRASCSTGAVTPLRKSTINRQPGPCLPLLALTLRSSRGQQPLAREAGPSVRTAGRAMDPAGNCRVHLFSHSRPPEVEPALQPARRLQLPTPATLAFSGLLAMGQRHRVTFRPSVIHFLP